jgi:HAD superfamily hydrolase (TIGR01549 family)
MPRGVLFDLGGTLVRTRGPEEVIESFLVEAGISKSLQEISKSVSDADASYPADHFVGRDFWKEWLGRTLGNLGIIVGREKLAAQIDDHWFDKAAAEPFPEALEVLERLDQEGIKMGAVTNGISSDMPHLVDETGLGEFFPVRVAADTVGRRKPNPRIFLHAGKEMGLPLSDIIFVGDEPDLDYRPSELVGMTPVLVDRVGRKAFVKNVISDLSGIWDFL